MCNKGFSAGSGWLQTHTAGRFSQPPMHRGFGHDSCERRTTSVVSPPVQTKPTVGSPQKSFTAQYRQKDKPSINELEEYFRLPAEDFDMCNPIHWWMGRRAQFPNLFRLACDILSIPGSAVAVEQVFSGGRDTISLRRASLKADTIRILMLVKKRLHLARTKGNGSNTT